MQNNLTAFEQFQQDRYGNILKENNNPLEAEEFENGAAEQEKQIQDWQNEQPF